MSLRKIMHFRRCHVCGGVTETEGGTGTRCGHCGKYLAPFMFFDERVLAGTYSNEPDFAIQNTKDKEKNNYKPVWGIAAYWVWEAVDQS